MTLPEDPFHPFRQTLKVPPHHEHRRCFVSGNPIIPRSWSIDMKTAIEAGTSDDAYA